MEVSYELVFKRLGILIFVGEYTRINKEFKSQREIGTRSLRKRSKKKRGQNKRKRTMHKDDLKKKIK